MTPSAFIAVAAWGALVGIVAWCLVRDVRANRRALRERRVPPRPAQVQRFTMAEQAWEIQELPTVEPRRTLR